MAPTRGGGRHRAELRPAEEEMLRLLRLSVADLEARRPELVLAIHQQLLVTFPGAAALPSAGRPVAQRLAGALLQAASVDERAGEARELLRGVGADNLADGLGPQRGEVVADLLLRVVRGLHQGEWSEPLGAGWLAYVGWLTDQLAAGAAAVS